MEECKGLPPYCITEGQYNVGCDPATEFVNKLNAAGVYCDYYIYGGCNHYAYARDDGSTFRMLFCAMPDMPSEYEPLSGYDASARLNHFQISCIKDISSITICVGKLNKKGAAIGRLLFMEAYGDYISLANTGSHCVTSVPCIRKLTNRSEALLEGW